MFRMRFIGWKSGSCPLRMAFVLLSLLSYSVRCDFWFRRVGGSHLDRAAHRVHMFLRADARTRSTCENVAAHRVHRLHRSCGRMLIDWLESANCAASELQRRKPHSAELTHDPVRSALDLPLSMFRRKLYDIDTSSI
jgi:hypothetical protein